MVKQMTQTLGTVVAVIVEMDIYCGMIMDQQMINLCVMVTGLIL
jgi:hypothetical protein